MSELDVAWSGTSTLDSVSHNNLLPDAVTNLFVTTCILYLH